MMCDLLLTTIYRQVINPVIRPEDSWSLWSIQLKHAGQLKGNRNQILAEGVPSGGRGRNEESCRCFQG